MRLDFSKGRVLVVGDLMLDQYSYGTVSRISPEAPVPIVKVVRQSTTLGGAGNVANNLAHLGAGVELIGVLGNDEAGKRIGQLCGDTGISLRPLLVGHPTINKTRVIGEHQQVVRIDCEEELQWTRPLLAKVRTTIRKRIRAVRIVVISDYGKGLCTPDLCGFIIREARKTGKPVIVDPKGLDWSKYRGATVVTPNVKELSDCAGAAVANRDESIAINGKAVRRKYGIVSLLVTRSERGMTLIDRAGVHHVPTVAREVFDVSGAGDTVVATLAAGLAAGYALRDCVGLANKAAGIVVAKIGTAPIELDELDAAVNRINNPKLLEWSRLVGRMAALRTQGKKIVFTNGCFDILHRGNVHLLDEAKRCGDVLVVALNSDVSAAMQKGRGVPVNTETDRAHLIGAVDAVDYVTIFSEKTPINLIRAIRPDVIVKGGNYRKTEVLGKEYAGRVVIIPQLEGYSTEEIARRIGGK
ncbi:MAG: D-glycero-beta-D-manno-heptose-7-phosphate kinase [Chitinispirillaceae bacterium]|nr:D-glycero-beta-D-manno-heptose-7-phosphate kinase [Chitinispirillaceae bacterium]